MRKRKFYIALILIIVGIMFWQNKESKAETCVVDGTTYIYDLIGENAENVRLYDECEYNQQNRFSGSIKIPDNLNGHTVVSVGDSKHNILGLPSESFVPVGVHVGSTTLYFCRATSFKLPSTIKKINPGAFYGIEFDTAYEIPEEVESIGARAFANVNIRSGYNRTIIIPDSVQEIEDYAFANTFYEYNRGEKNDFGSIPHYWLIYPNGMNELQLGSGVSKIGKYAFLNQKYLKKLTIPQNVTEIQEGAFLGSRIESLNIEDEGDNERQEKLKIGDYAFKNIPLDRFKVLKSYEMGSYVFEGSGLTQIEFGEGVTSIPEGICYNCKDLKNVTKTDSVVEIENEAFRGCIGLETEDYHNIVENITTIGNAVFARCTGLTENLEVKNIVESLGENVFSECSNIETVQINANIKKIPAGTFFKCTSLKDITKPSSVTEIGDSAFYGCTSLTTGEYHDIITNITTIGNRVFEDCTGLTGDIEIKEIVTSLGSYVFSGCSNIKTVQMKSKITEIQEGTFYNCTSLTNIQTNILKNITKIGKIAFKNCTSITGDLTINNIVTYVGESSFENCTGITNILFEQVSHEDSTGLTIGEKAFYNAAKSQEIAKIYCNNLNIGAKAFSNIYEAFIYCEDKDTTKSYNWYGNTSAKPIVHYLDCTHNINITCKLPGVTLVNPNTEKVLETTDINCEDDFTFKILIQEEYKEKYKDLCIKVVSEGQYSNSDAVEKYITLNEDNTYTLDSVNRNKKIIVQQKQEGTDLVLRQYISEKNGKALIEKRKVNEKVENEKLAIINYNHSKYPLTVKKADKITYTVRVYNEGKTAGQANEITVRLGDGLKLAQGDSINDLYGWTTSDDGKTIKTTYLNNKPIESYSNKGKPNYEEIQYVLEVIDYSDEDKYTVTLAEISEGNDLDALEGSITNINLTDYMKEECYTSSADRYLQCVEDDTDIEAVLIEGKPQVEYNLVVNKIDSLSNELLNGAKIQLLNENKEVIKTAVTENGKIDFGSIISYGEGKDVYYLNEIETPTGYLRTMEGMVELQVIKTLNDDDNLELEIVVDIQNKEDVIDNTTIEDNIKYIPIYTEDQLRKIGSNESIEINGTTYVFKEDENYQLQNDIETTSNFTPIKYMKGIFDGNNHSIGFGISGANESTCEIGMFSVFSGTIMNLNINASVNGANTTEGKESKYNEPATGVLVGYMESGTIKNVNIAADVFSVNLQNAGGFVGHTHENGTVEFKNCTYNGRVCGKYNVGGLVGCAKGKTIIDNCTKDGEVRLTAPNYNAGGLIGVSENDVTIKNCEVNGSVSSDGTNIGGMVGYTSAGNTVVIKECTNKATINANQMAGGIVGYNESIINIFDCTNEAQIACNKGLYSGGIIGYSNVTGDAPADAVVGYDQNTKTITLNIKNKETEDEYKININKIDSSLEEGKQGLSGARFNIYDKSKQLIQENSEVDSNGYLTLKNIVINSLVTDVYFIKEVEAPAGYDILIKDYIKLEVTKIWDGVEEKYIINTNASVVAEPEEIDSEDDSTKTGTIVEKLTYTNVRYKTNKTTIQNCTNSGNVTATTNSGGIAGSIRGYCLVDGCINENGNVVATTGTGSGGIVGDIAVNTKDDEATVSNCTNKSGVRGYQCGGIIGMTGSTIEITNCENSGEITPVGSYSSNLGGIVGSVLKIAIIDNCTNKGLVVGDYSGGIVGSAIGATDEYAKNIVGFNINCEYLEITNCHVSDCQIRIQNGGNSSGIIAAMCADECIINNNTIENTNVYTAGNSSGGIVAVVNGARYIEIQDCNIINSEIVGSFGGSAGVIGSLAGTCSIFDGDRCSGGYDSEVRINNCNVYGGKIVTTSNGQNIAGIIGVVGECSNYGETSQYSQNILITNCGVHADENGNPCEIMGKWQTAGIVRK